MTHDHPTVEVQERATLYALGVLDPAETAAFESHLAEGCAVCRHEVDVFADVVGYLGVAASARPVPELRDHLLTRAGAVSAVPTFTIVRAAEGRWELGAVAGMEVRRLFRNRDTRRFTALARLEAGVAYPAHRHAETEELYMLEGDLTVDGQLLQTGDYCFAGPGTLHHATSTRAGCAFLLHASEADTVVERADSVPVQSGLVFIRASEGFWTPGPASGVRQRTLHADRARGTWTGLVRMEPGARLQGHRHRTAEQFYMLDGDAHVTGHVLHRGDYYWAPAGSAHDITHTEAGCLFLLVSSSVEVSA